jgi:hypothetical protein
MRRGRRKRLADLRHGEEETRLRWWENAWPCQMAANTDQ